VYNLEEDVLYVNFINNDALDGFIEKSITTYINKPQQPLQYQNQYQHGYSRQGELYQENQIENLIGEHNVSAKLTCRYEIHLHDLNAAFDFQLSKKIIGAKGNNMKKVLEACLRTYKVKEPDLLKLRLRGIGSGFKEGPHDEECEEPLH